MDELWQGHVTIPSEVKNAGFEYVVAMVGDPKFEVNSPRKAKISYKLLWVTVPASVKIIFCNAFQKAKGLKRIDFQGNILVYGDAFSRSGVEYVSFPPLFIRSLGAFNKTPFEYNRKNILIEFEVLLNFDSAYKKYIKKQSNDGDRIRVLPSLIPTDGVKSFLERMSMFANVYLLFSECENWHHNELKQWVNTNIGSFIVFRCLPNLFWGYSFSFFDCPYKWDYRLEDRCSKKYGRSILVHQNGCKEINRFENLTKILEYIENEYKKYEKLDIWSSTS